MKTLLRLRSELDSAIDRCERLTSFGVPPVLGADMEDARGAVDRLLGKISQQLREKEAEIIADMEIRAALTEAP